MVLRTGREPEKEYYYTLEEMMKHEAIRIPVDKLCHLVAGQPLVSILLGTKRLILTIHQSSL